jgi:16S rRNA (cytosine1402-N4)-methyltransferase
MSRYESTAGYHTPVLLHESVDALMSDSSGVYVDATLGGGGHSRLILSRMNAKGRLFGFDQDLDAVENVPSDERFIFVHANFRFISHFMKYYGVSEVNGILADLGVSSHHFDAPERGFTYRENVDLDMRMNKTGVLKAADVLNTYTPAGLQEVFSKYGEVRNAKTLATLVCQFRENVPFEKTADLLEVIDRCFRGDKKRYSAQVFQSLRIEVNDEMGALYDLLRCGAEWLAPGGKMVVISYHSIEDRMVKRFFRERTKASGLAGIDEESAALKVVTRKPILPKEDEIVKNSRAASARMRIAEKI